MPVKLRYNSKFNEFLRSTLGIFLFRRYSLRVEHKEVVDTLEPPFIVLPNHVSFWDPFFVAYFISKPVYYVVSDMQFRRPIIRLLLGLVGAIPKSKAVSDFETVRNIFRVKQKKGVIGLFPEGRRNWDGHNIEPVFATSKLVKALKIPVVIPILKGAYLSLPRWSKDHKKGVITVDFRHGLSADDVKRMDVDEIHTRLTELISYDEWEYQREAMIEYKNRHRAEHIELALFACPQCNEIGGMRSRRHTLFCSKCDFSVVYNTYGFFEDPMGSTPPFDTVRSWNLWQLELMSKYVESEKSADTGRPVISDGPVCLWKGYRTEFMKKSMYGHLSLYLDRVELICANDEPLVFELDDLRGVNVQLGEIMEFYHKDTLYAFDFKNPWVSGFKWMVAIHMVRGEDVFSSDFLD